MTHDSELRNSSDLNEFKIPEVCENGLIVNHELYVNYGGLDDYADVNELKAMFDQVVSFFLKEVSVNDRVFRPIPPKLGNGQEADLFKLFLTIRRIGSYELASKTNLWEFVARECGIEIGLVASLKLIYIKYLKEFDQWLLNGGYRNTKMENMEISIVEKLDLLSRKLGTSLIDVEIIGFEDCKEKIEGTSLFNQSLIDVEIIEFEDCKEKIEGTSRFNQAQGGTDLDFSRNDGDDDDEKFSAGDHKRCESSPKFIKKVGFSMVDDEVKRKEMSLDDVLMKVRLSMFHDDDNVIKSGGLPMLDFDDDDDDDVTITDKDDDDDDDDVDNVVSDNVNNQKRKRDEEYFQLSEMLDWVANAARDPCNKAFKTLQRSNKGKNYTGDNLRKQALSARRALFAELNVDLGNEACGSQKKTQRMHPSMYEDDKVKLRCSRRATAAIPSPFKRQQTKSSIIRTDRFHEIIKRHDDAYNLGPLHQAQVPPWTGVALGSDPKWLGTQMWAPPNSPDSENEGELVTGLGSQGSCECECIFPGSAECVRFHVAENRLKVKRELGPLFYKWKFNQMGEEISLSWVPEEEKRFKSIVIRARHELAHSSKSRREIMNKFWRNASDLIPGKLKQNVVSYYFNVFVLRRRSYQNRVTPREIDSDNDEEEVGSVGDKFGYEKIHGLSLKCSENLQCTDLQS